MNKVSVRVYSWENPRIFESGDLDLKTGDLVIVETEWGIESGKVVKSYIESRVEDKKENKDKNGREKEEERTILRRANASDLKLIERYADKEAEALEICRAKAKKNDLPMKIISAHFSFDGSKIIFPFTAEKKVDFRELIKTLSQKFQKSIRLQQIGSRDEARMEGGFGLCGRELCCGKFSGGLKSVTAESARVQQLGQKGSDRLSGLCGRLRCCLGYEVEQYKEASVGFPRMRAEVTVKNKKGIIIDRHILAREVTVEFANRIRKRIPLEEIK